MSKDFSDNNESTIDESEISEEVSIDVESTINDAIQNTIESENFKYDFKIELSLPEISADLSCVFIKNNDEFSSVAMLKSDNSIIYESKDFFSENFAFIDDKIIGKSKFKCEKTDFLEYIKNNNLYYAPLSSSKNIVLNDNSEFEGDLTEQIITENFYSLLLNSLSIDESVFESGSFILSLENNLLKEIEGQFTAKAIFDEIEIPIDVVFVVECSYLSAAETPLPEEYTEYDSMKSYLLSKAIYNLALKDAYSTYSETRMYLSEEDKKEYIDISSEFSTSFMAQRPMMNYNISVSDQSAHNYERFIYDGQNYERAWIDLTKPEFTISDADIEYSQINSLKVWNSLPFNLYDTINYSIEETDIYYIIQYEYKNEKALEYIISDFNNLNECFDNSISFLKNIVLSEESTIEKAIGVAKIRKEDFIIIEQSLDVSAKLSDKQTIKIISSFEVLALNEDVSVLNPKK
jgi:hypothetical protein